MVTCLVFFFFFFFFLPEEHTCSVFIRLVFDCVSCVPLSTEPSHENAEARRQVHSWYFLCELMESKVVGHLSSFFLILFRINVSFGFWHLPCSWAALRHLNSMLTTQGSETRRHEVLYFILAYACIVQTVAETYSCTSQQISTADYVQGCVWKDVCGRMCLIFWLTENWWA